MSTLTIELDSLTANRLQERSLQEGRKKEELAAGLLASSLSAEYQAIFLCAESNPCAYGVKCQTPGLDRQTTAVERGRCYQ